MKQQTADAIYKWMADNEGKRGDIRTADLFVFINSLVSEDEQPCPKCGGVMRFDYDESAWWCQKDSCDYGITNPRQDPYTPPEA